MEVKPLFSSFRPMVIADAYKMKVSRNLADACGWRDSQVVGDQYGPLVVQIEVVEDAE